MTDHNDNKIGLDNREEATPGGRNPQPAAPMEESALARSEPSSADPAGMNQAAAVARELPGSNPFAEMVGEVPLEAELHELAARNSGVQINETYQIQTDTPAGGFLPTPTGSQTSQDPLACIGMSVKIARTIEARGVPTGEASTTGEGDTPMQTVITHRDALGVIINVLDGLPGKNLSEPPGGVEADDLYDVNTNFAAGLLKDGGEEALAQLMEAYNPTSDFPLDVPALELDFNQFELDETGSGPETKSGPEEESGEPAIIAKPTGLATLPAPAETGAVETEVKTLSCRPESPEREDEIRIANVGTFWRESGQPVWLRAYPYIKSEPVPVSRKRPQAYRGQDHYNPIWTYVRGTRRDRLRALVKQWNDAGSPTEERDPASRERGGLYRNSSLGLGRSAWERITTGWRNVTGSS